VIRREVPLGYQTSIASDLQPNRLQASSPTGEEVSQPLLKCQHVFRFAFPNREHPPPSCL